MKYGCCLSTSTWGWDHLWVTQKAHYYSPPPRSCSVGLVDGRVGGLCSPPWSRALRRRDLVNRPHSRGIKEPLHRFVLEAVLLICLPSNECIGPVLLLVWTMALEACMNGPDAVPRERPALTEFPLSSRRPFPGHYRRWSAMTEKGSGRTLMC